MKQVSAEKLEELAKEWEAEGGETMFLDTAAERIRALIARAREEVKPVCIRCGRPEDDDEHSLNGHDFLPEAVPPASAGTEGPGKLRRYYVNTIWLHDEDIGEVAGETVAVYLASDCAALQSPEPPQSPESEDKP